MKHKSKKSSNDNLDNLIKKKYSYPKANDPDLLYKISRKREFNYVMCLCCTCSCSYWFGIFIVNKQWFA